METIVEFDKFVSINDAYDWMDKKLASLDKSWTIHTARITFINGGWQTAILFKKEGPLDIDV